MTIVTTADDLGLLELLSVTSTGGCGFREPDPEPLRSAHGRLDVPADRKDEEDLLAKDRRHLRRLPQHWGQLVGRANRGSREDLPAGPIHDFLM